ncbi:hypothetical protein COI95_01950 [Bacillus cereus]|nr:hypothetical protein COI95_01950 [Bacillus cereus]PGW33681.1 hypothetical protein COE04_18280 [Bacillus cereus]
MLIEQVLLFVIVQLQRLDCSVASLLPTRQKAPLRQKLHPPHNLFEPLALFVMIQLHRLEQSVISLLHLRQKAPLV